MSILDELGMTADDLRESLEPGDVSRNSRSDGLAAGSPGFGDHSAPTVPPAERRKRPRRAADRRAAVLGRTTSGVKGDVDVTGLGVGEEWVAAGLITEAEVAEARKALIEASPRAERAVRRRAADVDHAARLRDGAERHCDCSRDGGGDRIGCQGLCRMAERNERRVRGAPLPSSLEARAQRRALEIERERRAALTERQHRARPSGFREFLRESGDLDANDQPTRRAA